MSGRIRTGGANRQPASWPRLLAWLTVSLLLHVLLLRLGSPLPADRPDGAAEAPIELVWLTTDKESVQPEEEQDPEGQVVDLPPPEEAEKPDEADYLAEHDRVVPEETRTEQFRINPEVLAPEYSSEDRLELEDVADLGADQPSTGARAGNDRFDPDRDGALAALPHPYQLSNREGLQSPSLSAHASQDVSGAPNNDLLDEEVGSAVNLNTREFLYADYLNQVRRLVNFYWRQNLDNLPRGMRIHRPRYRTVVGVTFTADGLLDKVEVLEESGATPLDNAVVQAFRIAGPYPPPPEGLVGQDGRAQLGDMGFTVEVGQAHSAYMGIDPRAGVQFPGILKSPR